MGWLRNFVRRHTAAIPRQKALKYKTGLSFVYFFAAWNLFIVIILSVVKSHHPETEESEKYPSRYYANILRSGEAKVYKYEGFTRVGEYEFTGPGKYDPGRTKAEREAEDAVREQAEREAKEERRRRPIMSAIKKEDPELLRDFKPELLRDFDVESSPDSNAEDSKQNREDLSLLVEETNSL